ncbi:hypothetical protein [Xanthomarina sp. F2636L]|uniref:hypothetical protein n=1 Tax=Xanthomarina sp. F2636L TaxID=2996018 RepID=UPI00225DEE13|nr:hypothetical protein [Xanthomarina sp. F2636L]MCX7552115.1 hypothetical protein [Xanthomarina sp. F2636L]
MDASTVYQVAQALPQEEQAKLFAMLKAELYPKTTKKLNKNSMPDYTEEDALEYLFNKLGIH